MKGKFKIVVPSYNSVRYLPKTLASIEKQTNKNFDVCVIDDASTLPQQKEIIADFCQRNGWKSIYHNKNVGPLKGTVEAIRDFNCQDDDVIVIVDGDDWLYDENVLAKLDLIYTNEEVDLTWGSFITDPPGCIQMNYADGIANEVVDNYLYRQIVDIFGHLKTFKYHLFKKIKEKDFIDPLTGEYFRVSGDKALLYPMLEMAGYKARFISDILYVYNIVNPISDFMINRSEQIIATEHIRKMAPYKRLVQGD